MDTLARTVRDIKRELRTRAVHVCYLTATAANNLISCRVSKRQLLRALRMQRPTDPLPVIRQGGYLQIGL
jgi:hypothetical protein